MIGGAEVHLVAEGRICQVISDLTLGKIVEHEGSQLEMFQKYGKVLAAKYRKKLAILLRQTHSCDVLSQFEDMNLNYGCGMS
jgi:hypothetical protein